jgi:hypothetical protein
MRSRTIMLSRPADSAPLRPTEWHQQPIVWLGLFLFCASLAACVLTIVIGERYADQPLPTSGVSILAMPMSRPAATDDAQRPPK